MIYLTRNQIGKLSKKFLPFSDSTSEDLPLLQLLRLSLFQVSVGLATVMLVGTLNRVMIVELGVSASLVALMVAIPVLIAPFRAFLGFRSDNYRSAIGWKRIPYIWYGTLLQFGGLAIMPFSMIVLSGDQTVGPTWAGEVLVGIAFLFTGMGIHMTQTVGLALAADRATEETRPRVVALLYVMFLLGMGFSALILGALLADFSKFRLIQVVQGAAVVTLVLNLVAVWRQEQVSPQSKSERGAPKPKFLETWRYFTKDKKIYTFMLVVFTGTMAFSMQDILLEPYGGQVLGLSVSATTLLTAVWVLGALIGLALAARKFSQGNSPIKFCLLSLIVGLVGFSGIIFSYPTGLMALYFLGTGLIGFGAGLFAVCTLTISMSVKENKDIGRGMALGVWGASQATGAGVGIAVGGFARDLVNGLALSGDLGVAMNDTATGYLFVYHFEILLIFITIIFLGPLSQEINKQYRLNTIKRGNFGLSELPS